MRQVTIYSIGSSNHTTWCGNFRVVLECQRRYKYIEGTLQNVTTDQCTLVGIIEAVHLITEACVVNIITASPIAFGNFTRLKGNNKELKGLLIRLIRAKRCRAYGTAWEEGRVEFKRKLNEIKPRAEQVPPIEVLSYYQIPRASQLRIF